MVEILSILGAILSWCSGCQTSDCEQLKQDLRQTTRRLIEAVRLRSGRTKTLRRGSGYPDEANLPLFASLAFVAQVSGSPKPDARRAPCLDGKARVAVLFLTKTELPPINVLNALSSFVDVSNDPVCDLYST